MKKLSILSEPQDKLNKPPVVAKDQQTLVKNQLDIQVILQTKSLKIETSKCEGRTGNYWRYFLIHHLKLIALTNSGAVF